MSKLICLPGVAAPGTADFLEGLAAQARNVRRLTPDMPNTVLAALLDLEHHAETQAALICADELLANAELA